MATGLTVADARAALYQQIDPADPATPQFIPYLNQVCERIINSGQWKNMYIALDYLSTDGYITLPRRCEAIVGVTRVNRAAGVYARMTEFMTSGPGFLDDLDRDLRDIIDQGDVPTQIIQQDAGFPQFVISDVTDVGKTGRVYGLLPNGESVFDVNGVEGIGFTLANPSVTLATSMFVTQVVKQATEGNVTFNVVVNGSPVNLSEYEPSETNPLYRCYKVGTIEARQSGKPVLRCLCKRRFVKLVAETDLVWPDNIGALKFGLMAVKLEDQGAYEDASARQRWQDCYDVLNQGLKQNRGAIRPTMAFWYPESAGSTPRTH